MPQNLGNAMKKASPCYRGDFSVRCVIKFDYLMPLKLLTVPKILKTGPDSATPFAILSSGVWSGL